MLSLIFGTPRNFKTDETAPILPFWGNSPLRQTCLLFPRRAFTRTLPHVSYRGETDPAIQNESINTYSGQAKSEVELLHAARLTPESADLPLESAAARYKGREMSGRHAEAKNRISVQASLTTYHRTYRSYKIVSWSSQYLAPTSSAPSSTWQPH